ncbi:hypothetical protein vseg_013620 [Gypsophila vaccaria]
MPPFLRPSLHHLRRLLPHHQHHHLRLLTTTPTPTTPPTDDQIALSLSSELLRTTATTTTPSLSLQQRLDLSFSHVSLTPSLIHRTLLLSPSANRAALDFFLWLSSSSSSSSPSSPLSDHTLSLFVHFFGRSRDFKAIRLLLESQPTVIGSTTFSAYIDRLVRAGRAPQAVAFFDTMQTDFGIVRDREKYLYLVSKLCDHGHGACAEKMVKRLAPEFFPDEGVCDALIKGWCVAGKLEEAKRLAREMYRGGFELGTGAYNAILDCVCRLCRVKDPFRLENEAESLLIDMDAAGVRRDTETFNVLISNLCKIRKTEEGLRLFARMGEWGCGPDATTFLVLIRSCYQAARVGEGDDMIDRMRSAGFGDALTTKEYYGFLKILCGVERVDHALSVFRKMKRDGCVPGVKTYELLIRKLHAHGRAEKANNLFNEAVSNGVEIERKEYDVDPRFLEKPKVVKKGKKRLTLPEKTALKRKKLRKLRLSYVKKPRKMMRQAF